MSQTFKRQIRFVITGAAGFIGARLAGQLIQKNGLKPSEVLLVDEMADFDGRACVMSHESLKWAAKMDPTVFLEEFMAGNFPELSQVFHMGACSRTDETRWEFLKSVNLEYSQKIWLQCVKQNAALFYASSAATYGAGEQGYSDETDPQKLKPLNLYGQSKNEFDQWVLAQSAEGRQAPQWAGFKFFNVYGPFEFHKGSQASVLMHAFKQIQLTGRLKLFRSHNPKYPDGGQLRDFIHVDDVTHSVLAFAEKKLSPGIYNLGRGLAQSFKVLGEACAEALGARLLIDWIDTPENLREHYQYFTEAKTEKLRGQGIDVAGFRDLNAGAREYLKEWREIEKKGIALK